jgi:hypothetical protein
MLDTPNASLALVGALTPRWDKRLHLHQAGARATDSDSEWARGADAKPSHSGG